MNMVGRVALGLVLLMPLGARSYAQRSGAISNQSSGLRATIGAISLKGYYVNIQINLQNMSNDKIYYILTGARSIQFSNGIGAHILSADGIVYCNNGGALDAQAATACIENMGKDINKYSYLEAKDVSSISLKYNLSNGASSVSPDPGTTLSFHLNLIARHGEGSVERLRSSSQGMPPSPPVPLILNFPPIPVQ